MPSKTISKKIGLLRTNLGSTDLETRQKAAYDINQLCDTETEKTQIFIPGLKKTLTDHDWAVRKLSIMALGKLNVMESIPKIIEYLKNDAEPEVRVGAAEALGEMQVDIAIPSLILALDDSDEMLCQVAMWSLGRFGEKARSAVPKILEFLEKSENKGIVKTKSLAIWALGEIGDEWVIETL